MDLGAFRRYLQEYVQEAIEHSNGTTASISEFLWMERVGGRFTRQRVEKQKALDEARRAFDQYRHWPVDIVLSHLGVERTK